MVNLNITTNSLYAAKIATWKFYKAAYEGCDALITLGKIAQHERESIANYNARKDAAYSFNYSASVVDLLNQFLFSRGAKYDFGELSDSPLLLSFWANADRQGTSYDTFIQETARVASIMGHCIVVVDRPATVMASQADEVAAGVYPYLSRYWPQDILDWAFIRDNTGAQVLTKLVLAEAGIGYKRWSNVDGKVSWEVYDLRGEKVMGGDSTLKAIPVVWVYATKNIDGSVIGVSDIRGIAKIDLSIMRNLLDGEQIISYAAFPMLMRPEKRIPVTGNEAAPGGPAAGSEDDDIVGPTSVLEFDPTQPNSKPQWLEAKVKEPIDAILSWVDRKVKEIQRLAHLSGMTDRSSAQTPSGVALRLMFTSLNAKLSSKSRLLEASEQAILRLWMEQAEYPAAMVSVSRPTDFAMEEVAVELDQLIKAKTEVNSIAFKQRVEERIAELILPALSDESLREITDQVVAGRTV